MLGADDAASKLLLVQFLRQSIEKVRALMGIVEPGTRVLITGRKVFFRRRKLRSQVEMRIDGGPVVCSGTLSGMGVVQ